jgi:hypothetical protein
VAEEVRLASTTMWLLLGLQRMWSMGEVVVELEEEEGVRRWLVEG